MQGLKKLFWGTNLGIALLLGLLTTFLLSGVLIFRETTFFTNLDNVDQFYTWYQKLATAIHDGYLPIWNSNVFSGQSFAGELQPGVLYPINIIWVWLFGSGAGISQAALDWLVALHFVIAAFGCFLLLKQLGARRWAAFLAGLTFAFSGVLALRSVSQTAIFFGLALLPYPLYFLAKYHAPNQNRRRWLIFSGLALGLIILSGHIQPFFHAFLALVIFEAVFIYKKYTRFSGLKAQLWSSTKRLVVIIACALAIAAPQVWLSARYLPNSYRVQAEGYSRPDEKIDYGDFSKAFNIDVHEYANLIDPVAYQIRDGNNLFIGLVPLFLIILAVFWGREQFKKTKIWAQQALFAKSLLIFSIVAMLGYVTWLAVVLYELPFVYQIRQLGRYSILFHLALMIVLAAALSAVAGLRLTKRQRLGLASAGAFLLINSLYLFLLRDHIFSLHFALQNLLLGLALVALAYLQVEKTRQITLGGLIILTAAVNTLWFLLNILEQTNGQYRVEVSDSALPVNIGNVYKVQTTGGYGATIYAPYFEFNKQGRYDMEFVRDLLGVQLEIDKQSLPGQEVVYSDQSASIYVVKRSSALPKMFTSAQPGSTVRSDYQPLGVTTINYRDNYQKYSLNVDNNTVVIMSEIAYPGWTLKIDGHTTTLKTYTVGNTPLFKSFDAPPGKHIIELSYKPLKIL
ncbi:hypothetical protein HYW36_00165 [Candidatus Saccharibacteria bacterium]|nr:hypothetical protein [Candidatus Saccharibacteria bacterium]